MAALLHCLLRTCFGDPPEHDEESHDVSRPLQGAAYSTTIRLPQRFYRSTAYQSSLPSNRHGEDNNEEETEQSNHENHANAEINCCQRSATYDSTTSGREEDRGETNLRGFWNILRAKLSVYDFVQSADPSEGERESRPSVGNPSQPIRFLRPSTGSVAPIIDDPKPRSKELILKTASTFDESLDFPTICAEEIVMPGSKLQAQMALAAAKSLTEIGDECVICMEEFEPTNPRMPTLCGCGENKTYFHLPCLLQWIEQDKNCPSCRKRLRWEEF